MKAVLEYADGTFATDRKNVFSILAKYDIEILKTKKGQCSIYYTSRTTIRIKDNNELNKLITNLNDISTFGVSVINVKSECSLLERIKRFFE